MYASARAMPWPTPPPHSLPSHLGLPSLLPLFYVFPLESLHEPTILPDASYKQQKWDDDHLLPSTLDGNAFFCIFWLAEWMVKDLIALPTQAAIMHSLPNIRN